MVVSKAVIHLLLHICQIDIGQIFIDISEEISLCLTNGLNEPMELVLDFLSDLINIDEFIWNIIQNCFNFRPYETLLMIFSTLAIAIITNKWVYLITCWICTILNNPTIVVDAFWSHYFTFLSVHFVFCFVLIKLDTY